MTHDLSTAKEISLAMIGMIEGNGHPYSWSALVNGYNPEAMKECPYRAIPQYLGNHPLESVRIEGARVTHIWTDNPEDAPRVALASKIEHVVSAPEEVLGHVDAVIIATDDGDDHVRRARPFIEAGLPVFVDKPLATNLPDLRQFIAWQNSGAKILSTSGMRYMPEIKQLEERREEIGEYRWLTSFTCKSWERYGIHALECLCPLLGPGFIDAQTNHQAGSDIVHVTHRSGIQMTIAAIDDAGGSFGSVHVYGTKGQMSVKLGDFYSAFRSQLVAFIEMLRTGRPPLPFAQTVELMAVIIAGIRSREQGGKRVALKDILTD
jgi:predicted dehydrogenase